MWIASDMCMPVSEEKSRREMREAFEVMHIKWVATNLITASTEPLMNLLNGKKTQGFVRRIEKLFFFLSWINVSTAIQKKTNEQET